MARTEQPGNATRTPRQRAATIDAAAITSGTLDVARIPVGAAAGTVCSGTDSRLGDPRPLVETSGPTVLTPGAIPDGYLLQRQLAGIVGVDPATLGGGGGGTSLATTKRITALRI